MNSEQALILEKAKEEYVSAINQITKKYKLSFYFVSMILSNITNQAFQLSEKELQQQLEKEQTMEKQTKRKEGKK